MKLALVQMESSVGEIERNVAAACNHIDEAAGGGAECIVLPEFFSTGYFPVYRDYNYYDLASDEHGCAISSVKAKAREHSVPIVATYYERDGSDLYYNTSMLIGPDGEIVGKYRKVQIPAFRGIEELFFRPGSKFPTFPMNGWRVGIMLCYDTFFPESARCLALAGADLILVPFGASDTEKSVWREMMITRAFENGAYVAACNSVGAVPMSDGDTFVMGGRSVIVDPLGQVVAEAGRVDSGIVSGDIDRNEVEGARKRYFMFRDRRPDAYGIISTSTEDIPR